MMNAPNVAVWLGAIGLAYFAVALICAAIAWKLSSQLRTKLIGVLFVLGLFLSWPISDVVATKSERYKFQKRYDVAAARFAERCKIAGEKIIRTVDDVDGIFVLKMRTTKDKGYGVSQMAPGAAFYFESTEEDYLKSFLWSEHREGGRRGRLYDRRTDPDFPGYSHVDFIDPIDNKRYRYRLVEKPDVNSPKGVRRSLERGVAPDPAPRYGVTFVDMVDAEDRDHWIAGSILKVIDLVTNEEIARHTRFAFDRGLGGQTTQRIPWAFASYCPNIGPTYAAQTRHFVDQVLRPKVEK